MNARTTEEKKEELEKRIIWLNESLDDERKENRSISKAYRSLVKATISRTNEETVGRWQEATLDLASGKKKCSEVLQ